MKSYEEMAQRVMIRGEAMRERSRSMKKKMIMLCITVVVCTLFAGTVVIAVTNPNVFNSDIFYQAGQFFKEAQNDNDKAIQVILAKYDGNPITAATVRNCRNMNILRSEDAAAEYDTDLDVINKIIENMILLEEAERRGLLATEDEIEMMINNTIKAYSLPDGKKMLDSFLEGAEITFEEYLTVIRTVAPSTIARQKVLNTVVQEYCEENGLNFKTMNDQLIAVQKAYIETLFEQNKHN